MNCALRLGCGLMLLAGCFSQPALAGVLVEEQDNGWVEPPKSEWVEQEPALPAYPSAANLVQFYVGPVTPNDFFVDLQSISIGADGVVRYAIVTRTRGGAENATFEGIRCATDERRIYAIGRADGTWAKARQSQWQPISFNQYNRQRAALSEDYLCDRGTPLRSVDLIRKRFEKDQFAK
jgi:hypothetical protein